MRRLMSMATLGFIATVGLVLLASSQGGQAQSAPFGSGRASKSAPTGDLVGGPRGIVKTLQGQPVDGLMVQLISQKSAIRTTVYTNELGRYEFPKLETGGYTLRIARPREFRRYQKDAVHVDGATALPDIIVERVTQDALLPATSDILPQMTASELIHN